MVALGVLSALQGLQSQPASQTDASNLRRPAQSPDRKPPATSPSTPPSLAKPVASPKTPQPKSQSAVPGNQPVQKAAVPPSIPITGTLSMGGAGVTLRVAIAEGSQVLTLGSSTTAQLVDQQGQVLASLKPNEGLQVLAKAGALHIGITPAPALLWLLPAENGAVYVGDRWYRGAVQVSLQGNSLLVVNYVDLEEYLYSVVSLEVSPSWPLEAQKAQAIAARSFALVHYFRPASALYDLGSTERYQVYGGLGHEWNTSQQAVENTRGLILSYGGGVVESQYAASEELVKEVFGGRGMSQQGAYKLSMQGLSFQQILGYFYPGTSLSRLQAS